MIIGQWSTVLGHVHRLFQGGGVAGLSEGQLLDRFVDGRDEVAFGALVARHGPMVLGVCRGVLDDPNDVEDAFQATFLVLVRKAAGLRDRDLLGPWLYGVARKVALRARADASRRRAREKAGAESRAEAVATFDAELRELQSRVREEVDRLPANDRMAVVLCYLDGLTHEEAAERLGWPVGTVKGRLSRARDRLRLRLSRRGIALPSAVTTLAKGAPAAVPPRLIASTTLAAAQLASGQAIKAGIVSAHALALTEGVIQTMFMTKIKIGAAALVASGVLTVPGVMAYQLGGTSDGGRKNAPRAVNLPVEPVSPPSVPAGAGAKAESPLHAWQIQAEFAERAIKQLEQMGINSEDSLSDPAYLRYLTWSRRLTEARSAPGMSEADRRAALQAHLKRMEANNELAKAAQKAGKISQLEALETAYRLNEAYLWTLAGTALPQVPAGGGGPEGGESSPDSPPASPTTPDDEKRNRAVLAKLEERISMHFPGKTSLEDIKKYIENSTQDEAAGLPAGIPIYIDPRGLNAEPRATERTPKDVTVSINLEGFPLRTTLRLLLSQAGLGYRVEGGLLIITAESVLQNTEPLMQGGPIDGARMRGMDAPGGFR